MMRGLLIVASALAVGLLPSTSAYAQSAGMGKGPARIYETTAVTVRAGGRTQVFSQAALQQLPRATLADVEQAGTDKGPQGVHSWSGASLRDVVLTVDPAFCGSANSRSRLKVVSQDGWTTYVKWAELCWTATGGEALFHVKGCNECHGVDGEGAPKEAMRAGPALRERSLDFAAVLAKVRAGRAQHSYINPYTPSQLTEADLRQILDWLAGKGPSVGGYVVPESRGVILLAFEQDGQPMTGRDGLIQMVVGMDDFVNRFSHWVSEIDVE
jgi:mono/diheme cytochrome c family protein